MEESFGAVPVKYAFSRSTAYKPATVNDSCCDFAFCGGPFQKNGSIMLRRFFRAGGDH